MEPQAALVGADGTVELDAVAVVHLNLALVIHPGHPEHDGPLGGGQTFQKGILPEGVLVLLDDHRQGFQNLRHCLDEFRLIGVLLLHTFQHFINIAHGNRTPLYSINYFCAGKSIYTQRIQMYSHRALRLQLYQMFF